MKIKIIILFLTGFLLGCSSEEAAVSKYDSSVALTLTNESYGSDPLQTMDVYLPAGRDENTKVVVLVHGGSWIQGDKADLTEVVPVLQEQFPEYAIVNLNYRLATAQSPAFPKQINDIQKAIAKIESSGYSVSHTYAFLGVSAGAHLSMLYSYGYDEEGDVKAVINIVGPADFSDPNYTSHPLYAFAAQSLIGTGNPTQQQVDEVSPVAQVTVNSPTTISFYGGMDPLVPASQGPRLVEKLNASGVYNEFNFYPNDGHADWDDATWEEVYLKLNIFLINHF